MLSEGRLIATFSRYRIWSWNFWQCLAETIPGVVLLGQWALWFASVLDD